MRMESDGVEPTKVGTWLHAGQRGQTWEQWTCGVLLSFFRHPKVPSQLVWPSSGRQKKDGISEVTWVDEVEVGRGSDLQVAAYWRLQHA